MPVMIGPLAGQSASSQIRPSPRAAIARNANTAFYRVYAARIIDSTGRAEFIGSA